MAIITPQVFRQNYPEFSSTDMYLASQLDYWLSIADRLLIADVWGGMLDVATSLFVAHNLVLEAGAQAEANNGGLPGKTTGAISGKSVDKVSISYDTNSTIYQDAGYWNSTIYGTRFYSLLRMFGARPIQVGIGIVPSSSGIAWPGPSTMPGFTNF